MAPGRGLTRLAPHDVFPADRIENDMRAEHQPIRAEYGAAGIVHSGRGRDEHVARVLARPVAEIAGRIAVHSRSEVVVRLLIVGARDGYTNHVERAVLAAEDAW